MQDIQKMTDAELVEAVERNELICDFGIDCLEWEVEK